MALALPRALPVWTAPQHPAVASTTRPRTIPAASLVACFLAARSRHPAVCRRAKNRIPFRESETERWRTDEELEALVQRLEQPPLPKRLPDLLNKPPPCFKGGVTAEEVEAIVEEMVPQPSRFHHSQFDPHTDDPLTKGIDIMLMPRNKLEQLIVCPGCGIPLQTHDPTNVGYTRFSNYVRKWSEKQHRRIYCTRCLELQSGLLRPVVKGAVKGALGPGFGGHVVPADVLTRQLRVIRMRRCLVVYILDLLDFNGSIVRNLREIVGRNPLLVIGTKIDLLPPRTDLELVHKWLRFALRKKRLRALDIKLVSNETGRGVSAATNALLNARRGMDVFVVGAANAGKSMFISNLLQQLEQRFPEGKVENCVCPLVSATPGTTLGTIPLRAFRRSAKSPVFSSLFDTPGVHQPNSMQNLLPIEAYNQVQPTRSFGVHNVHPAKDVIKALRASGEPVTSDLMQAWLKRPVRYLWGFPGEAPVAAVELAPPVLPLAKLSFVAASNLTVACEVVPPVTGQPAPPTGLALVQVCYVKVPEQLSVEGEVLSDIALTGFGWVAVTAYAVSEAAAGRPVQASTLRLHVYGPRRLKVKMGTVPMPVAGLPGDIVWPADFEEDQQQEQLEHDADDEADEQAGDADEIDPEPPAAAAPEVESTLRRPGRGQKPAWVPSGGELGKLDLQRALGGDTDIDDCLPDDDFLPDDDLPGDELKSESEAVGPSDWLRRRRAAPRSNGRLPKGSAEAGEPRPTPSLKGEPRPRNARRPNRPPKGDFKAEERPRHQRGAKPVVKPPKRPQTPEQGAKPIGRVQSGANAGLVRRVRSY